MGFLPFCAAAGAVEAGSGSGGRGMSRAVREIEIDSRISARVPGIAPICCSHNNMAILDDGPGLELREEWLTFL